MTHGRDWSGHRHIQGLPQILTYVFLVNLKDEANPALEQIMPKIYATELKGMGVGAYTQMGIAFSGVIINLVNNGMEAMAVNADLDESFNGALSVTTQMGNRHYTIEIADNRHGIPEDMMNQIFTPFYTSKPPGSGNIGLGLAICYDIVTVQHGGELSVHSSVGRGTTFIVKLPII